MQELGADMTFIGNPIYTILHIKIFRFFNEKNLETPGTSPLSIVSPLPAIFSLNIELMLAEANSVIDVDS